MSLKNRSELLNADIDPILKDLRKIGLDALELVLNTVNPRNLMKEAITIDEDILVIMGETYDLSQYDTIYVIGGGKATAEMAFFMENILADFSNLTIKGLINIQEGIDLSSKPHNNRIRINYASHPIPNQKGLNGVRKMMELLKDADDHTLIFCLISGGGSALLPYPKEGVSLDDLQLINEILIECGASIQEINTIRKHLSQFKGGNLIKNIREHSQCPIISLIISDVVGDDLDIIASGPTVPDSSTFEEALNILQKYDIREKIPSNARALLEQGKNDPIRENPKKGEEIFTRVDNHLIGTVKMGAKAVSSFLKEKGFSSKLLDSPMTGEAREFAKNFIEILDRERKYLSSQKIAFIATGELTVTIIGDGVGGRNQEMLLSMVYELFKKNIDYYFMVLGANLDGLEGNSDAMGAIIDNSIFSKIEKGKVSPASYLKNNDSNSFFQKTQTELITGPTGCNVNDIVIVLIVEDDQP